LKTIKNSPYAGYDFRFYGNPLLSQVIIVSFVGVAALSQESIEV
jgi:hypothetical protein